MATKMSSSVASSPIPSMRCMIGHRGTFAHRPKGQVPQKNKGSAEALPFVKIVMRLFYSNPFSCSSWQSMQKGVQGTACRRFSPITAPQFVQMP
jgi:hypothetical protein